MVLRRRNCRGSIAGKTAFQKFALIKVKSFKIILVAFLTFFGSELSAQSCADFYSEARTAIFEVEDYEKGLNVLKSCIESDTENDTVWALMGYAYKLKEEYKEAFDCFNKSIDLNQRPFNAYLWRGELLTQLLEYDAAEADLLIAIERAENTRQKAASYNAYGILCNNNGKYIDAYINFSKAYDLDSNDLKSMLNLGSICFKVNREVKGYDLLRKVLAIDSTETGALCTIGYNLQKSGLHEEAVRYFNKAILIDDKNHFALSHRGTSLYKLYKLELALKDINKSLEIFPTNSFAYKVRAEIYLKQNKIEEACQDLQTAKKYMYTIMYGPEVEALIEEHCR